MITRRHFLSSCAVTAATPSAVSAQTITDPFNITVTSGQSPPPYALPSTTPGIVVDTTGTAPINVAAGQYGSVKAVNGSGTGTSIGLPIGTKWQPGVTYNKIPAPGTAGNTAPSNYSQAGYGIPNRTTIHATLSPLGSGQDDTPQINAALAAAGAVATYANPQVVLLTAGTFLINGSGVQFGGVGNNPISWVTLRGAGPGTGATGGNTAEWTGGANNSPIHGNGTGTFLVKADRATNPSFQVIGLGNGSLNDGGTSVNLTADTVFGAYSCTVASVPSGLAVGKIVLLDHVGTNDPNVYYGYSQDPPGGASRSWFIYPRQNRQVASYFEVAGISGNTITFTTPIRYNFQVALSAQLTLWADGWNYGNSIEELCCMGGMGGDGHGNISMSMCAYSWIKHVEAYWNIGISIGLYACFRCELRDSFIHASAFPSPGGGGYLSGMNGGSTDCLFENNIMWSGNKVNVMRITGGGNVVAYNYMDDAFGESYPNLVEAGVNAGHFTLQHHELIEGNWSQNYKGDCYWGNSIYITVFRNWLTALRGGRNLLGLNMAAWTSGGLTYEDQGSRFAVDLQDNSYYTAIVGNVLGMSGQTLVSGQTTFKYESLDQINQYSSPPYALMCQIGADQNWVNNPVSNGNWGWIVSYQWMVRDGNWDWVTQKQLWLGLGGSLEYGAAPGAGPATLPNSFYLTSAPAFFGSNTWPWVDPSTGTTHTLPAKHRFDSGTPNVLGS
jgi:hypothetical protein